MVCFNFWGHFVSKFCKELEVSSIKTYVVYLRNQRSLFQSSYSCFGRKPWETLRCCGSLQINKDQTEWNSRYSCRKNTLFSQKNPKRTVRTTVYINNLKCNSIPCYKQNACMSRAVACCSVSSFVIQQRGLDCLFFSISIFAVFKPSIYWFW